VHFAQPCRDAFKEWADEVDKALFYFGEKDVDRDGLLLAEWESGTSPSAVAQAIRDSRYSARKWSAASQVIGYAMLGGGLAMLFVDARITIWLISDLSHIF
jgi:hypothetical protein